jgi:hypothetical protein
MADVQFLGSQRDEVLCRECSCLGGTPHPDQSKESSMSNHYASCCHSRTGPHTHFKVTDLEKGMRAQHDASLGIEAHAREAALRLALPKKKRAVKDMQGCLLLVKNNTVATCYAAAAPQ